MQVHLDDGHRCRRRLPLQVPELQLAGCRKSRSGDAEADVHPSGLSVDRRAVDEQTGLFPQTEAHQQHF